MAPDLCLAIRTTPAFAYDDTHVCQCRRLKGHETTHNQRYEKHRCDCGNEWRQRAHVQQNRQSRKAPNNRVYMRGDEVLRDMDGLIEVDGDPVVVLPDGTRRRIRTSTDPNRPYCQQCGTRYWSFTDHRPDCLNPTPITDAERNDKLDEIIRELNLDDNGWPNRDPAPIEDRYPLLTADDRAYLDKWAPGWDTQPEFEDWGTSDAIWYDGHLGNPIAAMWRFLNAGALRCFFTFYVAIFSIAWGVVYLAGLIL